MFAPGSGGHTASSLRSSRRRQRTSLEDAVKPPAAKRQRSSLRREPKQSAGNKNVSTGQEHGIKPSAAIKAHGVETDSLKERTLAIRSSEKTSKAPSQTDHAIVLVWLSSLNLSCSRTNYSDSLPTITIPSHNFHLGQINLERQFQVS